MHSFFIFVDIESRERSSLTIYVVIYNFIIRLDIITRPFDEHDFSSKDHSRLLNSSSI